MQSATFLLFFQFCNKFDVRVEDNLIGDFEKKTRTCLDAEKQIKYEEKYNNGFRKIILEDEFYPLKFLF